MVTLLAIDRAALEAALAERGKVPIIEAKLRRDPGEPPVTLEHDRLLLVKILPNAAAALRT